jgi:DNA invertase Pin-like site-specific DNA recombinase
MKVGYARVSTGEQNLDLQRQALTAAGCEILHEDQASGALNGRKGFADAIARCAAGDLIVVWKLDRLGRSLLDLVNLVEDLKAKGVGLKVLTGQGASIDTSKPEGRMIFAVFAALAEFERELIRERTKAGMAAAKRRGKHVGRPRKLTPFQLEEARRMIAGDKSKADVAALLGVDVATLRRALNQRAASSGVLSPSLANSAGTS